MHARTLLCVPPAPPVSKWAFRVRLRSRARRTCNRPDALTTNRSRCRESNNIVLGCKVVLRVLRSIVVACGGPT
eukprot:12532212-Alexandrium_andersonii.AAC.1